MSASADVILIHWNEPERCAQTAAQFVDNQYVGNVVIVDNGSTTENRRTLSELLGDTAHVIDVGFNSGFGPAANRGWERWLNATDGAEWSIVAPHDAIVEPDTVERLLSATGDRDRVGLLSADVGDKARPEVDHVFGPILLPAQGDGGYESVDYPHGTLMMASRQCLTEIGLFDERYFAYCEEADLGLRAQAAGFDVGLVRGARVHNPTVGTAKPIADYLMERNTILLVGEHFGRRKAALRLLLTVWHYLIGSASTSRRNPYWSAQARRLAIRDALLRRWGAPPTSLRLG